MSDLKSIIAKFAPKIASQIGGPLGGAGMKMVLGALGMEPDSTDEQLTAVLDGADGETLLKLKEAEIEFDTFCVKADIDLARIDADDRSDARERQVKTGDKTPAILGGVVTLGFFAVIALLATLAIRGTDVDPVVMSTLQLLLGTLGTVFIMVCTYFFGSSVGSKQKTANSHEARLKD